MFHHPSGRLDLPQIDFLELSRFHLKQIVEIVKHFEGGCLCVLTGRIEKQAPGSIDAERFYLDNCTCSRHPESASRECWDHDKDLRKAALQQIAKR